jgi:hypothetical protein
MIAAVALITTIVACGPATPKTGEELLLACREFEKTMAGQVIENRERQMEGFATCIGVIAGIEAVSPNAGCAPEDRPPEQAVEVVIKYLKANPAQLHRHPSAFVGDALREAWPCN